MADMTKFYTRVQLKYDTWANWNTETAKAKVPLKGEVCLVEVPTGASSGMQDVPPSVLMKVGDGVKTFGALPWLSALAADVHAWAKLDAAKFVRWLNGETVEGMTACPVTFATDAELATVNSAVTALETRVGTAEGKITTLEGEMDTAQNDISDLKEALGLGGTEGSGVTARVKALEDSVGTPVANANGKADGTAYERIAKNAGDISTINSKLDIINGADTVDGSIAKALKDAKAYSDAQDASQNTTLKKYAEDEADAAETAAKSYADGLDAATREAFAAADTAINARVTTLVGSVSGDDTKSARAIAAEEVAKVVDGAPEALDTLKEIATWIGNDTMGAASIVANLSEVINEVYDVSNGTIPEGDSRIDANERAIASEKSRAEGKEAELLGLINDLKGSGTGSVSEQISSAITTAKTQWEAYADQAEADAESAAAAYTDEKVAAEKSARESAVAGVQGQIQTLVGSENGTLVAGSVVAAAIATAKQEAIDAAASDATTKANNAKSGAISEANSYTDEKVGGLKSTLEAADATINDRLDVLEEKVNITKDTVDARISAAIVTAAGDATTKANKALDDAKAYADGLKTTIGTEQKAITDALDARLDVIEGEGEGSIKKAVADEATLREAAVKGVADRVTPLETAVGASTDAANAAGSLYARVAQNKADIASEVSRVDGIAARPFVAVESNDVNNYIIFYCGTASEMI